MSKSLQSAAAPADFSLALGGPLYQLYLRTRLARPPLELLHRRMLFFPLLTWLPPLVLSFWGRTALGGVDIPFLRDIVTHARFLVALPLFILAERVVHQRIAPLVEKFTDLIPSDELPRFNAAVASALRLRNSVVIEVILLLATFTLGHGAWQKTTSLTASAWYGMSSPDGVHLTPAGMWYAWLSMPLFQFIFFRWYYRLFIWARFLWQVSKIPLRLIPTHPDRAGGLGFLAVSVPAFSAIVIAQGAVLAGLMAGKIFFDGASLTSFKLDMLGIVAAQVVIMLGPLCVFLPQLAAARRQGLVRYGTLATRYVEAFDGKWNRAQTDLGEKMLGSADIQSLADLGNSFNLVHQMQLFPFGKEAVLQVIIAALLPVAPLVLTLVPLDKLITKLLGIPF